MYLTPIILSAWSYKEHITHGYTETLPRLEMNKATGELAERRPTGALTASMIGTDISVEDYDSIHNREKPDSGDVKHRFENGERTNEIVGTPFKNSELEHNGTAAWDSLKDRLAEKGIVIDEDEVAVLAAGFYAQRKIQDLFNDPDPEALKAELDLKWVHDIEFRPDREEIAEECYNDLKANFPRSLESSVVAIEKALGFDPNVVEIPQ